MSITVNYLNTSLKIDEGCRTLGGAWYPDDSGSLSVGEPEALEYLYNRLKSRGNTVLYDIGASSGEYCFLTKLLPNLRAIAFEPLPDAYKLLYENIRLNDLGVVIQAYTYAVSDVNAEATLSTTKEKLSSGLTTLGEPGRFVSDTQVTCKVATLDYLFAELSLAAPSVIKIDTEGCELKVLRGAEQTIARYMPDILFEYNVANAQQFNYHPKDIFALLLNLGYTSFTKLDLENIYCTK